MSLTSTTRARNLRPSLAREAAQPAQPKRGANIVGIEHFTGDASTTAFYLPRGQKPFLAFVGATPQVKGDGNDWEDISDADLHGMSFAVAPGSSVIVTVITQEA